MKYTVIILLLLSIVSFAVSQQKANEKIVVELKPLRMDPKEILIILKDTVAYIPAAESFNYLGIKADYDTVKQELKGFFLSPDTSYKIDVNAGTAQIQKRTLQLTPQDYVAEQRELYLRIGFVNDLFGLDFRYSSRRVSVELRNTLNLPGYRTLVRKRRREREAAAKKALPEPGYYLGRTPTFLGAGRLDWTAQSQIAKSKVQFSSYNVSLGLQALGGDLTMRLIGSYQPRFTRNDLREQLRYPFLGNNELQQVIFGDIITSGLAPRSMFGAEVTNRPLALRYSYSREVFRGTFDPNVDVQVTNVASGIQYFQTNGEGGYQFEFPELYGQGDLEIRAFDQWGQEHVLRYRMNIPQTLVPAGEVQYSLSAGRIRPPSNMYVSSNSVDWGISSALTVGTIIDYYNADVAREKIYTGITATSRLAQGLIFDGVVAPNAFGRAGLNWIFYSTAQFSLTGTKFSHNQFFNPSNLDNQMTLSFRLPVNFNSTHISYDFFLEQSIYQLYKDRTIQVAANGAFGILYPTISAQAIWRTDYNTDQTDLTALSSTSSFNMNLPPGIIFQPAMTYDHILHRVEAVRAILSRRFPNSIRVAISYNRFPQLSSYNFGVTLEYYFPFLRAEAGTFTSGAGQYQYSGFGSGSVTFDPRVPMMYFDNRTNFVGFGGAVVRPFVDENGNGVRDKGEQLIDKARIFFGNVTRGTRPIGSPADKLTLTRLPYYEEFDVYLDPQSLDNPIWVPMYSTTRLLSEPNYVRQIDIPVVYGGFVRGTVMITNGATRPAETIQLLLKSTDGAEGGRLKVSRTTSTFSTGEFEFAGVPPGKYRIELVDTQLSQMGFVGEPANREVEVTMKKEGDVVENVNFTIKRR